MESTNKPVSIYPAMLPSTGQPKTGLTSLHTVTERHGGRIHFNEEADVRMADYRYRRVRTAADAGEGGRVDGEGEGKGG